MARTIEYNAQFNNARAVSQLSDANYYIGLPEVGGSTVYTADKGISVTCTGYYTGQNASIGNMQRYWLLQTTGNLWILCDTQGTSDWLLTENSTKISGKSQSQAQAFVNTIISNNRHILSNNLLCARFADRLTKKEQTTLYNLQYRLQERNSSLQNDSLVTNQHTGTPAGYKELQSYLSAFMNGEKIGVVWSAVIIISAVVIASLSTAAWFAYKYYAAQSEDDVKYSDELTKTLLSKLTEEEYNQLMAETKGIVTKATIKARLGSNISKYIGLAALVVGGLLVLKNWKNK